MNLNRTWPHPTRSSTEDLSGSALAAMLGAAVCVGATGAAGGRTAGHRGRGNCRRKDRSSRSSAAPATCSRPRTSNRGRTGRRRSGRCTTTCRASGPGRKPNCPPIEVPIRVLHVAGPRSLALPKDSYRLAALAMSRSRNTDLCWTPSPTRPPCRASSSCGCRPTVRCNC